MALWHAHLDTDALVAGAHVQLLSDYDTVRVVTADRICIEASGGQRVTALVVDRSGDTIVLNGPDGETIRMSAMRAATPYPPKAEPFSHETWLIN
jgi:hypothetical protein